MAQASSPLLFVCLALFAALSYAGICNDKRIDCANWAKDGECGGDNSKFMATTCPLSCGICTHVCNDTDASCGSWAKAGECEANPDAMLRICPTSCGLCTPECKDLKEECPGENAKYMAEVCPLSCGTCTHSCSVDRLLTASIDSSSVAMPVSGIHSSSTLAKTGASPHSSSVILFGVLRVIFLRP